VDHWIGKLFEGLEERNLFDETIVILLSDHGEEFFDHGHTGHGYSNYKEMLHVPLVIHHPDVQPGVREGLVSLIDVAPTVAEMVGAPERPDWQGRSFFTLLLGNEQKHYRFSFAEKGHRSHEGYVELKSVQDGRYKLIRLIPSEKDRRLSVENRLYDLQDDPREMTDISAERPKIFERFNKVLDAWLRMNSVRKKDYRAGDTILDPETREQLEDLGYTGKGK
jgi:arylsulfatase A-like enzyme